VSETHVAADRARAESAAADAASPEHLPRYGLLLVSACLSIAVQGIAPTGAVQQVVVTALAGSALVLALRAGQFDRRLVLLAGGAAIVAVTVSVVQGLTGGVGNGAAQLANAGLLLFGPPAVAVGILRDLRTTGQVRLVAVMGVLALYMLIGLLFAFTYGAIDRLGPSPLFANDVTATASHCVYFSFITLTTVGYGDVVTQTDLGHTLSLFEALIGQIYLVTVVSLIVSNLGRRPGSVRRQDPR
jgi:Ion channel